MFEISQKSTNHLREVLGIDELLTWALNEGRWKDASQAEAVIFCSLQILGPDMFTLVANHCIENSRPDWRLDLEPICPITGRDRSAEIDAARTFYVAWWDALDLLSRELAGKLERFEPTPPAAPRRPWADISQNVLAMSSHEAPAQGRGH